MNISITKPQPDRADWTLEINGCRHFMTGAALAALHGVLIDHFIAEDKAKCAAQAALAEQNSGVKAETRTCRCNLRTYGVDRYPVCKAEFKQDEDEDAAADFCDNTIRMLGDAPVPCGHCKSCHS